MTGNKNEGIQEFISRGPIMLATARGDTVPREKEVPEYAACLLVCGPPNVLAQPVADREPTSSLMYRAKCSDWYNSYVRGKAHGYAQTYSYDEPNDFDGWWLRYKLWLMEAKHG